MLEDVREDLDRVKNKTRSNLDEDGLALLIGALVGLIGDLIVAEVDALVDVEEGEDVVHERLHLGVSLGAREGLTQQLLHQEALWGISEGAIKVHYRARTLEAVASELDF